MTKSTAIKMAFGTALLGLNGAMLFLPVAEAKPPFVTVKGKEIAAGLGKTNKKRVKKGLKDSTEELEEKSEKVKRQMAMTSFEKAPTDIPEGPSITGPTGLIRLSTAYVLSPWDYDASIDVVGWRDFVKLNLGLPHRIEAGVTFVEQSKENGSLNLKWQFVPEGNNNPGVAVGFFDIASSQDRVKYIMVSKKIIAATSEKAADNLNIKQKRVDKFFLRAHGGFQSSKARDSFVGGVELKVLMKKGHFLRKYLGKTTFIEEYDGKNLNFGMRYELTPISRLHFGVLSPLKMSIGLSYRKNL